jgi:ATP-dependent DNA helicase RecQ
VNVLRILEQEGHLQFNEQIFLPTQVHFNTDPDSLKAFEEMYPSLEPLIKALLRTYAGIFYNRTSVYELSLARICHSDVETITKELKQLHNHGIIAYLPKKETPQIHFLLNRAPAQYLHIHQDHYLQRKQLHTERISTMVQYATLSKGCRSNYIGQYFGDNSQVACGVCDHCLNKQRTKLSEAQIELVENSLKKMGKDGISLNEFLEETKQISHKKIWTILDFLQSEAKISITEDKKLIWISQS